MQISTLIGVAAALVVLLIVFGSLLAAFLPLLSTGIALVAGISVVGALSNSISMASFTQQLCVLIGLGVGIDYSLFILTRTRTGLRRGLSTHDAVVNASATAGHAVLFAGITVCKQRASLGGQGDDLLAPVLWVRRVRRGSVRDGVSASRWIDDQVADGGGLGEEG